MNCRKVKKKLVLLLDGELASPEAEIVRNHLEGCPECREEAESLRLTLDVAVHRSRQRQGPAPPPNFVSLFWRKKREGRRGRRAPAVRHRFAWLRGGGFAKYALASILALAVVAAVVLAVIRSGKPPQGVSRGLAGQGGISEPVVVLRGRLADIEGRLKELEGAVSRLSTLTDNRVSFTKEEMREIVAAIGLAAANSYRDVLKMHDVAAERYAQVAAAFPETTAGRKAGEILSGLN